MRGSVRLAALSGLHVIYVWTHDSVGLGEDGPTHQPVEHYAALRAIPNLWFVRPGDANETAAAWALRRRAARDGPVALALTRQKLPTLPGTAELAREGVAPRRLRPARGVAAATPDADPHRHGLGAAARASRRPRRSRPTGSPTRVVSLPCWERFEAQDQAYRDAVLPPAVRKRVTRRGRRLARLGALGRRRGRDHRARPLRRVGARPARSSSSFGFTVDRVADVGRRVVRDGLRGRIRRSSPGATRRSRRRSGVDRATGHASRARLRLLDAHRVRRRPRRGRVQGRAARAAGGADLGGTS